MRFAHFTHVDGELGDVDYEAVVESRDDFQLTYQWLRETKQGEHVARYDGETGSWVLVGGTDSRPYSDVCFTDEWPASVVMATEPCTGAKL